MSRRWYLADSFNSRPEMRLPGEAWLDWTIDGENGRRVLRQCAYSRIRELAGRAYWFAMLPSTA